MKSGFHRCSTREIEKRKTDAWPDSITFPAEAMLRLTAGKADDLRHTGL